MTRRAQFNISALRFSDEVHAFLEKLSSERKLSEWLAEQVTTAIRRNGMPMGCVSCSNVSYELKEIKQLLLSGCLIAHSKVVEVEQRKPVVTQISSDSINQLIDENDLAYGF
ncbi:hypothetical protein [Paenibacillus sinopodophylli]|uniref:hypothetical protein n=1 Tax=Paenibacillus sinopodophylli TaxID=1837342 RepID=UPI00110D1ABF|nr:hypothetical protein [Paenibacillus sinopodophylli]